MPFCPGCRQEFEAFAARCPDCDKPLVATLEARAAAARPAMSMLVAADRAAAERMIACFAAVKLPSMEAPGDEPLRVKVPEGAVAILVPEPAARAALMVLDRAEDLSIEVVTLPASDPNAEESEIACSLIRCGDRATRSAPAALPPTDVLSLSPEQARARGEVAQDELAALLVHPDGEVSARASLLLSRIGDDGVRRLARELPALARRGADAAFYAALKRVKDHRVDPAAFAPCVDVAYDRGAPVEIRRLALHGLGQLGIVALHEKILPLLDDPEPDVREEADEALCALADDDLGFDPEMPRDERLRIIEEWKRLFAQRES